MSGRVVHLHSLSSFLDRERSSRSSSLAIRRQEGVSGPRMAQPFIFIRYPPPGRRIRTPSGPSSLPIRRREGVFGPRMVQPFIPTRYPPPGRRIRNPRGLGAYLRFRTVSGPAVHLHKLSAARKAYLVPEWSSRSSLFAIRHQEGVSGPQVVHLHSPSATGRAFSGREWSSRLSPLDIRHQEGVSGTRGVYAFIFTRDPPPGRRIRTPSGPVVHLHSPPTALKAFPDRERSGVYLHSLSAARKAYPDPEWSSRSSSLAIYQREGVSGSRMVPPFIPTRYPPPGRRIRTPSGPAVHLHSLCAAAERVSGPRVVQAFIFTRYPPPGRRIRTPSGLAVHLHSPSAAGRSFSGREWSSRLSPLDIRHQEGVSGTRGV